MKQIKLTQGKFAIVDDDDFEYLNKFKWHAHKFGKHFYAERVCLIDGKTKSIFIHNEVGKPKNGFIIDHIDRNGLNCQKSNLRQATRSQNCMNRIGWSSNKYKGVTVVKNRFRARIRLNRKQINIGYYLTDKEAAIAYNNKAIELFGEFALLNEIKG